MAEEQRQKEEDARIKEEEDRKRKENLAKRCMGKWISKIRHAPIHIQQDQQQHDNRSSNAMMHHGESSGNASNNIESEGSNCSNKKTMATTQPQNDTTKNKEDNILTHLPPTTKNTCTSTATNISPSNTMALLRRHSSLSYDATAANAICRRLSVDSGENNSGANNTNEDPAEKNFAPRTKSIGDFTAYLQDEERLEMMMGMSTSRRSSMDDLLSDDSDDSDDDNDEGSVVTVPSSVRSRISGRSGRSKSRRRTSERSSRSIFDADERSVVTSLSMMSAISDLSGRLRIREENEMRRRAARLLQQQQEYDHHDSMMTNERGKEERNINIDVAIIDMPLGMPKVGSSALNELRDLYDALDDDDGDCGSDDVSGVTTLFDDDDQDGLIVGFGHGSGGDDDDDDDDDDDGLIVGFGERGRSKDNEDSEKEGEENKLGCSVIW